MNKRNLSDDNQMGDFYCHDFSKQIERERKKAKDSINTNGTKGNLIRNVKLFSINSIGTFKYDKHNIVAFWERRASERIFDLKWKCGRFD